MGLISDIITGKLSAQRAYHKHITLLYEGGKRTHKRKNAGGIFTDPEGSTETVERLQMIREARQLEEDFPLAAMILDTYDIYAFGSIRYQPMTGDIELNREISDWLKYWFTVCDYTGRFDFDTLMQLAQRGKKRDGESGIIDIEDAGGYKIQLITGERIGNPTLPSWSNDEDQNGIRLDKYGRVIGYDIYKRQYHGGLYSFDKHIPASWFNHIFDPFRVDNYHGVTCFKSVITRMRDLKETMDYSRLNIKYRSTQLPYFKTEDGQIPTQANNYLPQGQPLPLKDADGVTLEQVDGGEQQFLKTTEGIFEFPNDFPNQQFLPVIETQVKEIMAGVGLSYDFLWKIDKLTGTVGRLVVEREDRVMQNERKKLERQAMRRIVTRAIEAGYRAGAITRKTANKFRGEFFYGARISADYGRDAKADIEVVNAGLLTETEYQHIHGRNPEDVRTVRFEETLGILEDAKKITEAHPEIGIENASNLIRKAYPNPPKSQTVSETVQADESLTE